MTVIACETWHGYPFHDCGYVAIPRPYEELSTDPEGWPSRLWCDHCRKFVPRKSVSRAVGLYWTIG